MRQLALIGSIVVVLVAAGCSARTGSTGTTSIPSGSAVIYVYLQPLPREASGVRAELGSVAAVAGNGVSQPLTIRTALVDGTAPQRQRLVAVGAIPAGEYTGLQLAFSSARLAAGTELSVADQPSLVDLGFTVRPGEASIVTLEFSKESPIVDGHAFEPVITAGIPRATELSPAATAIATLSRAAVVTVFHKITGEVFDVFRTERAPRAAAYDSRRQRVYVACSGADLVEVHDLALGAREQSFPLTLGDWPSGLAISRDAGTIVVTNRGSNTVSVLDGPILAERFRIQVGPDPVAVLLAPDETRAVVFLYDANSLALIDLTRGLVLGTVPVDAGPVYGAFDRDGRNLLVIHRDSPFVDVVDLGLLRVVRRINVGTPSEAIVVGSRTGRVFLAHRGTDRIEVFDPSSLLPIDAIDAGADVSFLAIDRETEQLLAVAPQTGEVRSFRVEGGPAAAITEVGEVAAWIDVAGGSGFEP